MAANKAELLRHIQEEQAKFGQIISDLKPDDCLIPGVEGEWSVKDIAAHLDFWQRRAVFLLDCVREGWQPQKDRWSSGSVDQRNLENYRANKDKPFKDVLMSLLSSETATVTLIEMTPEEDLLTPGRFEWVGTDALIERIGGETYQHYQEHYPALAAWRDQHR